MNRDQWHSEACRQEAIGRHADQIEQDIIFDLWKNERELIEIGGDIIGFMEPETMAMMLMLALVGDKVALHSMLLEQMNESVKRIAEHRAVQIVEQMVPDGEVHGNGWRVGFG